MFQQVKAWMIFAGDTVNGKTVKHEPTYTDRGKSHIRIEFADGTSTIFEKNTLVTVTRAQ